MISKAGSIIFTASFLLFILGIIAYLDSEHLKHVDTTNFSMSVAAGNEETEAGLFHSSSDEGDIMQNIVPIYEYKLIDSTVIEGYRVETYREYEIFKNKQGKVIKSIPTSNYDYIRYMVYD
ncbi:hypothetical protein LCL95_06290 [Bacillus timonensis]|nr:hypothetical protein [Bacillus timonensis]